MQLSRQRKVTFLAMAIACVLGKYVATVQREDALLHSRRSKGGLSRGNSFPRWGVNHDEGIDFKGLLGFMAATNWTYQHELDTNTHVFYVDHYDLYTADMEFTPSRLRWMEKLFDSAMIRLRRTKYSSNHNHNRWFHLRVALQDGGFPFLHRFDDDCSCNSDIQWNDTYIPIFMQCAPLDCHFAWPIPTRALLFHAQNSPRAWDYLFQKRQQTYPWHAKIKKAVWRGSLTGKTRLVENKRFQMCRLALNHTDLLDVKTNDPSLHPGRLVVKDDAEEDEATLLATVAQIQADRIPFDDFAKNRAVLDIDGHAWSSRFGMLLCLNSVVLKVDPDTVDYFYPALRPWVHFVPVAGDFSDLVEKAAYVMNDTHDGQMQQIVANANGWCRENLVLNALVEDTLDILEDYVRQLNLGDPNWSLQWKNARHDVPFFHAFRHGKKNLLLDRLMNKARLAKKRIFGKRR